MPSINDILPSPKNNKPTNVAAHFRAVSAANRTDEATQLNSIGTTSQQVASLPLQNGARSDLVPLYSRGNADMSLTRPSAEVVEETKKRTQLALQQALERKAMINAPPKTSGTPEIVRYTPASVTGTATERTLKIIDVKRDPLEPPRHKHVKAPPRPPSPPAPILRAPAKPLTAEEKADWAIPRSISGWKNTNSQVIATEERVKARNKRIETALPNPNQRFGDLSDALTRAEADARQELEERAREQELQDQMARQARERHLQELSQRVRRGDRGNRDRQRSRSPARRPRDVSERVQPAKQPESRKSGDAEFDSRLYAMARGSGRGWARDVYDEPLFNAQKVVRSLYTPKSDAPDGPEGGSASGETLRPIEFEKDE